jgi:hypothetical protein
MVERLQIKPAFAEFPFLIFLLTTTHLSLESTTVIQNLHGARK